MSMTMQQLNFLRSLPGWDEWCARLDAEEKARKRTNVVLRYYSICTIADRAGLSESTVRRDRRIGHLVPTGKNGNVIASDIVAWLRERNQRCGGLTVESKAWLEELENSHRVATDQDQLAHTNQRVSGSEA